MTKLAAKAALKRPNSARWPFPCPVHGKRGLIEAVQFKPDGTTVKKLKILRYGKKPR